MASSGAGQRLETSSGELFEGQEIDGKYVVERLLGEGGMGAVYRARNELTGRPIAIKALRGTGSVKASEHARVRLLREARAAAAIRHPNVVDVYDVVEFQGSPLLVMELLEGESVADLLDRGTLPVEDAIQILVPAMRGVAAAHEQGVVHRDLKPENLFLCRSAPGPISGVKVLDFGISKWRRDPIDQMGNLTQSGTILGTPRYMAPEQLTAGEIDARSDVYALGVILYELLSGVLPHEGETFALMSNAKLSKRPTPIRKHVPTVPKDLEKILNRALATDPMRRFQTVAAFAQALEPFGDVAFGTRGIELASETGRSPAASPRGRTRLYLIAALLLLVVPALTGAVVWLLGQDPEPTAPVAEDPATDEATQAATPALDGEDEDPATAEGAPETAPEPLAGALEPGPSGDDDPEAPEEGGAAGEAETVETTETAEAGAETESPAPTVEDTPSAGGRGQTMRGMRGGRGRTGRLSWDDF